jgi:phasin
LTKLPPIPKETTMAQPKSKAETAAESAFDSVTKLEVPAAVRDFAEKGVAQAKDAYAKFKVVADDTSDMLESAYSSASRGCSTLGLKAIETMRANSNATFDHLNALFGAKTFSDVVELQTAFVRSQAESLTAQTREFAELAQKVASEASAPVKAQFEKALKISA